MHHDSPGAPPRRGRRAVVGSVASRRPKPDEGGGDAQENDAMDVDGQGAEGNAEEGEDQVEQEEENVVEESVGGSDLSKNTQGPVVPMFRWVSTTYVAPAETSAAVSQHGEKDVAKGDVDMADIQPPVEPSDAMEIEPSASSQVALRDAASAVPVQEKQMRIYLAVPAAFLPSSNEVAPPPLPESRPPAICAVSGCQDPRKYRLVKDWQIGACGIAHLKVLEAM